MQRLCYTMVCLPTLIAAVRCVYALRTRVDGYIKISCNLGLHLLSLNLLGIHLLGLHFMGNYLLGLFLLSLNRVPRSEVGRVLRKIIRRLSIPSRR